MSHSLLPCLLRCGRGNGSFGRAEPRQWRQASSTTRSASGCLCAVSIVVSSYTANSEIGQHDGRRAPLRAVLRLARAGKLADLIVTDQNMLQVPAVRISATKVLLTMVGGDIVFRDPAF